MCITMFHFIIDLNYINFDYISYSKFIPFYKKICTRIRF